MKLIRARVTNFRSIEDSDEFDIGDLTCLVGKNEAGKTGLLQALYGIRPFATFKYDKTRDYPRRYLSRFDERHPKGASTVAKTTWALSDDDLEQVKDRFGDAALDSKEITIESSIGAAVNTWGIKVNARACLTHMIHAHGLDAIEQNSLKATATAGEAVDALTALPSRSTKLESLLADLKGCRSSRFDLAIVDLLQSKVPKFFYTSHFDRMSGEVSLTKLLNDQQQNTVSVADQIFLDFLEYAGTSIEDLLAAKKFEDLVAQCEGASNDITDEIFQFWSQNDALQVKIQIGEGKPEDQPPLNSGTVAKIRIENLNHRVSVPLSERSAGFVWFFSFLSQFKQLKKTTGNAIILLDEPGLTLHGKAQADLLRYIEERLLPEHQVIYSTHSPFMVPSERLANVRVVEDVVKRSGGARPVVLGTKVSSDILAVDKDTLFPLQGHLGYEITQSLFIGKNTLLVEGPSDILYLQAFSQALYQKGRVGLDSRWTICPSGGIDKIWPFASLFGGNKLNIAVLTDFAAGDKSKLERLRQSQILKLGQLHTAAEFTGKNESDIEDLLGDKLYLDLVNATYQLTETTRLDAGKLASDFPAIERILKKAEAAFRLLPATTDEFNHFAPSGWLIRNPAFLEAPSQDLDEAMTRFEQVFKTFNSMLPAA